MAKSCPGCGAPMEYDPGFDALVCGTCGNIIDPKTLPDADSFYYENEDTEKPEDIKDTLSEFEELTGEMYDRYVFKCSQCAGEVLVSSTEISTRCIYCGSTSVVFSRITKENRPDKIVPFMITKEEAIATVKEKILSGAFMPRGFKKIDPELVRGIYIPYFTYDGAITDTQQHAVGASESTHVFDGSAEFENLLVECCKDLDDRFTALLEPYNVKAAVDFDTSYLMGFYSNTQDVTPRAAKSTAELKARTIFNSQMRLLSPNKYSLRVYSNPKLEMYRTGYILLPAWFVTITANGIPYTFLVNGQSGKCAGTAPWSRFKVFGTIALASSALCALLLFLLSTVEKDHINNLSLKEAEDLAISALPQICIAIVSTIAFILLFKGISKLIRLVKKQKRTGSVRTLIFARRRQGGVK